ncbi:TRAP transporter large permease [Fulvivirga sedimenti]|uniref:TRAP transporter large permease subunit n=1 Tax=Fulvivirga sedimenti TaxID=2879465 RepID=A0A9X1KVW4_9BACT|nr:TRAP transporter large permease subunit [Fulvivirga sedimenti]MCA6074090.1 TRAP transporter large permease subunit [Fulvivirga sedimenti]
MEIAILLLSFFILMALRVPVAWSIGIASLLTLFTGMSSMAAITTMSQRILTGLDSTSILAIPFFILAGHIMKRGGIARRLVSFAKALVGGLPGGLAHVNILAAMLFGAIAGSAGAAAASIGSFMSAEMKEEGYSEGYGVAVNVTSATTGLLIPPSNIFIIYSLASGGVSIGALFLAGYLPGILTGLLLMVVAYVYAIRKKFKTGRGHTFMEILRSFVVALPSLLLLVVIMGGIVGGIFTATEASAVAVLYCIVLALLYREITFRDIPNILIEASGTIAVVMLLIAMSIAMSWVLSFENIPAQVTAFLFELNASPWVTILLINIILLVVGIFMDMTPAVLIFTPIFLPVATSMGIHPVHFGIIMVLNLCIGLCTPPVGAVLFIGVSVAETTVQKVIRPLLPFFGVMLLSLILISVFPEISLWLPDVFGFLD